jgi:hypothetical protein
MAKGYRRRRWFLLEIMQMATTRLRMMASHLQLQE